MNPTVEIQSRILQAPVRKVMTEDVKYCHPYDCLETAIQCFWDQDCGIVPVVHEISMELAGVLTDRDACIAMWSRGQKAGEIEVASVMTGDVVSVRSDDTILRAHQLMRDFQVRRLPVLGDRHQLVGMVSLNDLAREAMRLDGAERERAALEVAATLAAVCLKQPESTDARSHSLLVTS